MSRSGTDGDGDGWVEWCTEDPAWSYVPSLSCGRFVILVNRDSEWNVPHGYGEAIIEWIDEDGEPVEFRPRTFRFAWCRELMRAACAYLAAAQDHPNVQWVAEAADVLWHQLEEDDVEDAARWIVGHIRQHGAKTVAQLRGQGWIGQRTRASGTLNAALFRLELRGEIEFEFDTSARAEYGGAWRIAGTRNRRATSSPTSNAFTGLSSEDALWLNQGATQ